MKYARDLSQLDADRLVQGLESPCRPEFQHQLVPLAGGVGDMQVEGRGRQVARPFRQALAVEHQQDGDGDGDDRRQRRAGAGAACRLPARSCPVRSRPSCSSRAPSELEVDERRGAVAADRFDHQQRHADQHADRPGRAGGGRCDPASCSVSGGVNWISRPKAISVSRNGVSRVDGCDQSPRPASISPDPRQVVGTEEDPAQADEVEDESDGQRAPPQRPAVAMLPARAGERRSTASEAAMQRAPDHEFPGRAVPDAAQHHGQQQIAVGPEPRRARLPPSGM